MNLSEKVGSRIRQIRQEKGLSQEELAFRTGLQQSQIYRIENGKRRFNSEQLEKISQALDVPIISFFQEENEIEQQAVDEKLRDLLTNVEPGKRKQILDVLLSLEDDITLEALQKAIEIIKIARK